MMINYERLVLKSMMRRVVRFLGISWTNDFLHHEDFVGSKVRVREGGWSSDQVAKPIYLSSLTDWKNKSIVKTSYFVDNATFYQTFGYNINSETYEYFKE
jgi:hypothetical protein